MARSVGDLGPLTPVGEADAHIGAAAVDVEREPLAVVIQLSAEVADDVLDSIGLPDSRGIGRDDQVCPSLEPGVDREGEVDSFGEIVAGEVNHGRFIVENLDPFEIGVAVGGLQFGGRIEHDFRDNHRRGIPNLGQGQEKEDGREGGFPPGGDETSGKLSGHGFQGLQYRGVICKKKEGQNVGRKVPRAVVAETPQWNIAVKKNHRKQTLQRNPIYLRLRY